MCPAIFEEPLLSRGRWSIILVQRRMLAWKNSLRESPDPYRGAADGRAWRITPKRIHQFRKVQPLIEYSTSKGKSSKLPALGTPFGGFDSVPRRSPNPKYVYRPLKCDWGARPVCFTVWHALLRRERGSFWRGERRVPTPSENHTRWFWSAVEMNGNAPHDKGYFWEPWEEKRVGNGSSWKDAAHRRWPS